MDPFDALADPVRRALLVRLRAAPARVVDLAAGVAGEHPVSRPAISRHLRILAEAGLVVADEHGRERHYRLVPAGLAPVTAYTAALTSVPPFDEHALDGLDLEVRRTVREDRGPGHPPRSGEHRISDRRSNDSRTDDGHTDDGLTDDSAPRVTGSREITNDGPVLVLRRSFRTSPEDVWAACTEPGRLERWIGTWDGDPADGHIDFRMTAEGEDVSPERYDIEVCEPPHRLVLRSAAPLPTSENPAESMPWVLGLTVTADPGPDPRTTLAFTQHLASATAASVAASIGPGWEYYLDRLVAATDPALKEAAHIDTAVHRIRWEDYLSGAEPYRQLFS